MNYTVVPIIRKRLRALRDGLMMSNSGYTANASQFSIEVLSGCMRSGIVMVEDEVFLIINSSRFFSVP